MNASNDGDYKFEIHVIKMVLFDQYYLQDGSTFLTSNVYNIIVLKASLLCCFRCCARLHESLCDEILCLKSYPFN